MKDKILDFIATNEADMLLKLKDMVLIQSGTYNKKGIDEVLKLVMKTLQPDGLECHVVEQKVYGNHLLVSTCPSEKYDKQILMTGHMDTVFPADTEFKWFKQDEKYVYGPGVIDMKGGLVAGIYALKALASVDILGNTPLTFVFNSDEEIGSPTSKEIIEREAKRSAFAFVLESGGINGGIVTGRKGKLGCTITVQGKAGHAAFAEHDKPSAILELSHKILAIEGLNNLKQGLTVNVGTIKGGISPNTIPDQAWATADIRFQRLSDRDKVKKHIKEIAGKTFVSGTHTETEWTSKRLPMEQTPGNKALYQVAARQANELGFVVEEEYRSGVSDANIIASQKIPVIDGLGPRGARDHSAEEHMIKDSLKEKTQLLALLILESWRLYEQGRLF